MTEHRVPRLHVEFIGAHIIMWMRENHAPVEFWFWQTMVRAGNARIAFEQDEDDGDDPLESLFTGRDIP
jgi:hypothetical protein